ncbi:MAG TPA: hypothetical protein PLV87_11925 [Opitutaceae bacterium]|nr:hypothetical protein [Opitutaceae bacterium]
MLEAFIESLSTEDPGLESPAETRERLKDQFPRNASRRMTRTPRRRHASAPWTDRR